MLDPEWINLFSISVVKRVLGKKFNGPGIYDNNEGDLIIVVPHNREIDSESYWDSSYEDDERFWFWFFGFNGRASDVEAFQRLMANIPRR